MNGGKVMKVTFSVDLHDSDGDVYDECILLYIGDCTIIKLKKEGLNDFINSLKIIQKELKENYGI
jgi:hypothetical protein